MCGINGLVFLKGVERTPEMMNKVRFLFNELMVETQDRGHHATGLASFKRDGSYDFYKSNESADKMTTSNKDYLDVVSKFDAENSSVVIAHTRWYTKGLPSNNNNNHPFDVGNVVGIHNGSVKNDDELFTRYKFNRIGEVDSEIIFQLINHYNESEIEYSGLQSALEDTRIKGLFALAFVHKNNPNLLHLVKQEKPMEIAYWKEAGIVIFNSDGDYIEKAFRKLERAGYAFGMESAKQTYTVKKAQDDTYFTVDADAETYEEAVSSTSRLYLETSSKTTTTWSNTTTTRTTTGTSWSGGTKTSVKAKDSRGIVLKGEIDTVTGEVIIHDNSTSVLEMDDDEIAQYMGELNTDDGSGLYDEEQPEECFECGEVLYTSDITAHYNANNPTGEKICECCYEETMDSFMSDEEKEEQAI